MHCLQIYGNGKQTRSFQYVSDLVDGLIALMNSNYTQPINLGNPVEHTIEGAYNSSFALCLQCATVFIINLYFLNLEFAVMIRDLVGNTNSEIQRVDPMEDDPKKRRPDISRAQKVLKWNPVVPLDVGLLKTIEYFRKELQRSSHYERNLFGPLKYSENTMIKTEL